MSELTNPGLSDFVFLFTETLMGKVAQVVAMRERGQIRAFRKTDNSLVTDGDLFIEREIILTLSRLCPKSKMYFEEGQVNSMVGMGQHSLKAADYKNILCLDEVFFGDSIDCTIFFWRGLPGWSSQWSRMKKGIFDFSLFYAPDDLGGFLCVAEAGRGLWYREGLSGWKQPRDRGLITGEKALVGHTLSLCDEPWFHSFFRALKKKYLTVPVVPAGLGPALAACGKLDLTIVEPHNPWDIMHIIPMASEAKKSLVFWRFYDGKAEIFDEVNAEMFHPNALKVGCIVGNPDLVEFCIAQMEEHLQAFTLS